MKGFAERIGVNRKVAAIALIIVANAFVWYTFAFSFLTSSVNEMAASGELSIYELAIIFGSNFLGIAISAFLGSFLISKHKRRINFIFYWMFAGIIFSLLPMLIDHTSFAGISVLAISLGVYFGVGMPICMGYYSATTETGNRARLSGLIILSIGIGFFLLKSIGGADATLVSLSLVTWRALGFVSLVLLKPREKPIGQKTGLAYRSIILDKTFILYFIPWLMFSLINDMTFPVNQNFFPETFISSTMLENIIAGIAAVIGGFFADSVGRKRLTLTGFALLGLGYAVLGLFADTSMKYFGWWFYITVDGVAWGIFSIIFLITIWGDLAKEQGSEKYYVLGSLPYLLSNFTRVSLGSFVADFVGNAFTIFSLAAFFLFLAVLPVVYAPETLPEKTIKHLELKNYVEKAQKEAEKTQRKEVESASSANENNGVEFESKEFEEKLKEA